MSSQPPEKSHKPQATVTSRSTSAQIKQVIRPAHPTPRPGLGTPRLFSEVDDGYFNTSAKRLCLGIDTSQGNQHDGSIACFTTGRPTLQVGFQQNIGRSKGTISNEEAKDSSGVTAASALEGPSHSVPFPPRCLARPASKTTISRTSTRPGLGKHTSVPSKPHRRVEEAPKSSRSLDCCFWSGQGREDQLTERAIKEGLSEKSIIVKENEEARKLWPHLKNGGSLAVLSALFVDVLAQRQKNAEISAPTTFKPPPRVTLTDTKREAWMLDLADPGVPLRRLSRTIPHGLRGKALLEQCLAKKVPVGRAVWLAQCVGANELRAFRRKGVSGGISADNESKWNLEWTQVLESFNTDCVNSVQKPECKATLEYMLQLSLTLFTSGLLNEEHFLSWILDNLESCPLRMVGFWLAFTTSYATSCAGNMFHGRHLARALFERAAELFRLTTPDSCTNIKQMIRRYICKLSFTQPLCVLLPDSHQACKFVINDLNTTLQRVDLRARLQQILSRNVRIAVTLGKAEACAGDIGDTIKSFLNDLRLPYDIASIAKTCSTLAKTMQAATSQVLQWSLTMYYAGLHRAYLAVSILAHWHAQGLAVTELILRSVGELEHSCHLQASALGLIVAELVRQESFDSALALKWLITTGSMCRTTASKAPLMTQILVDMPTTKLTSTSINIRRMLLRGAGMSQEQDLQALDQAKRACQTTFLGLTGRFTTCNDLDDFGANLVSTRLTCGSTHEVAALLMSSSQYNAHMSDDFATDLVATNTIFILNKLNGLGDYAALLHFCRKAVLLEDINVQTWLALILNEHCNIFSSICNIIDIARSVLDKYCILRATSPPSRTVADSLLAVFKHLNVHGNIIDYLNQEIVLWSQNLMVTACSPFSDFQVEGPQSASSLLEETEAILAQSVIIDDSTVKRVFMTLSTRLSEFGSMSLIDVATYTALFSRIKRTPGFDDLARRWIRDHLSDCDLGKSKSLALLIRKQCFSIEDLLAVGPRAREAGEHKNVQQAAQVATMFLMTILGVLPEQDFQKSHQLSFIEPVEFGRCMRLALCTSSTRCQVLGELFSLPTFMLLFSKMLSINYDAVIKAIEVDTLLNQHEMAANIHHLVAKLALPLSQSRSFSLDPRSGSACLSRDSHGSLPDVIKHIFANVDKISYDTQKFALSCALSLARVNAYASQDLNDAIANAVETAKGRRDRYWTQLLHLLDGDVLSRLGSLSLDNLMSNTTASAADLDIIRAAVKHHPAEDNVQTCHWLAAKLAAVTDIDDAIKEDILSSEMNILLELSLIYSSTLLAHTEVQNTRLDILLLLSRLMTEQPLRLPQNTCNFMFDVAAYLATDLSPAMRSTLRENLGTLSLHPKIRFLFGFKDRPNAWLYATNELTDQEDKDSSSSDAVPPQPFAVRQWEMLSDSTPNMGVNDTALSLSLFGARRV